MSSAEVELKPAQAAPLSVDESSSRGSKYAASTQNMGAGDDLASQWKAMNTAKDTVERSKWPDPPQAGPGRSVAATGSPSTGSEMHNSYEELARSWQALNRDSDERRCEAPVELLSAYREDSFPSESPREQDSLWGGNPFDEGLDAVAREVSPTPLSQFRISRVEGNYATCQWSTVQVNQDGSTGEVLAAGYPYEGWRKHYYQNKRSNSRRAQHWSQIPCDNFSEAPPRNSKPVRRRRSAAYIIASSPFPLQNAAFGISQVTRDARGLFHTHIVSPYRRRGGEQDLYYFKEPEYPWNSNSEYMGTNHFNENLNVGEQIDHVDNSVDNLLPEHGEELQKLQNGYMTLQEEWTRLNRNTDSPDSSSNAVWNRENRNEPDDRNAAQDFTPSDLNSWTGYQGSEGIPRAAAQPWQEQQRNHRYMEAPVAAATDDEEIHFPRSSSTLPRPYNPTTNPFETLASEWARRNGDQQ